MITETKYLLRPGIYSATSEFTQEKSPLSATNEEKRLLRTRTSSSTEEFTQNPKIERRLATLDILVEFSY